MATKASHAFGGTGGHGENAHTGSGALLKSIGKHETYHSPK